MSSATVEGYPPARVGWTAVGVLLMLYALAFIDRQIISLMVAPMRADLGISDFQISLLQGFAFALLYSIFGLPLGMAVDRYSRRMVIFGGVLIWAGAATACGLAHDFPTLLAARLLVGAGEAALAPAVYSILADLFPQRRLTFALSVYSVGGLLGTSLSLSIGGLIVERAADGVTLPWLGLVAPWRFAFLVTGIPGLAMAFLIFLLPEPQRRGVSATARSSWADMIAFMIARWRFFACHFAGFACMMALAYARMAWAPSYLARRFDWSIAQIGFTLGIFSFVTSTVAMLTTGAIVDRWAGKGVPDAHFRFYVIGGVICTLCGGGAFLMPTPLLFFVFEGIAALPLGMAAIAASALTMVTPPDLRGRVSAVYLMVVSLLAMTVGPLIVGLLTDLVFRDDQQIHWSLATSFFVLGPLGTIAFALGLRPMREAVAKV